MHLAEGTEMGAQGEQHLAYPWLILYILPQTHLVVFQ